MPILLTLASAVTLSEFLEKEFLKRRGVDLYLDLTDWAKEIGIPYTTLRTMMKRKAIDPRINRRNLAKLIEYFGPPLLEAIGTPLPEKPKNPLFPFPSSQAYMLAEEKTRYEIKKEGK